MTVLASSSAKPLIYLDLDFMTADLHARLVECYVAEYGIEVTPNAAFVTQHHDGRLVTEVYDKYLEQDDIFIDLAPLPGALDAVEELKRLGHVMVVSTPSRNDDSGKHKLTWAKKHLGVRKSDIALLKRKYLLTGDIWLDDWHENITAIRAKNPQAFIGAIAYPHNLCVADQLTIRAEGYQDPAAAWQEILRALRQYLLSEPSDDGTPSRSAEARGWRWPWQQR